jgi:hypothetical protein
MNEEIDSYFIHAKDNKEESNKILNVQAYTHTCIQVAQCMWMYICKAKNVCVSLSLSLSLYIYIYIW